MAGGIVTTPQDPVERIFHELDLMWRAIRELEMPTGTQQAQALKQLQDLVAGLLTQVNGIFSGYVQAAGDIVTTGGYVRSPAGPLFDITTARRNTYWRDSDGRLAWASSSRERKTNIEDADLDPLAILEVSARAFNYKAEVAKRDDPEYPDYVGPDYHVAIEFGAIAEELHELGLWQVVIYEDHWKPVGIHYELLGLLSIRALKHVWGEHLELRAAHAALARDVEAIKILLGAQGL